jgi:arylsulfatase A-like enzyme/tetratricopeptide (TPR) repeat protein
MSPKKPPPAAKPPRRARSPVPILLVIVAIAAGGLWWFLRSTSFTLDQNPDRNVLLVTIDTLRADALGAYGGRATTPNLDRLAAGGARFTFAHAHAVVTLPSHASILSGRYPYEHGIRDNTGYRFPKTVPTAAALFKAAGFATGAFVGGFPLDHRFGLNIGFDVYDDDFGAAAAAADAGERERPADAVVRSALSWIGRQTGKWFAWTHVYDPHVPYAPPPDWAARFPSDPYLGEVSWTDEALGALFDRLAALPRPTLVIVTADHGESLGDHGELTHSIFAYEPTLHVPLVLAEIGAGRVASSNGVIVNAPVRHVDLLPTLLDAVGVSTTAAFSGASFRDTIGARSGADRPSYFEAMTSTLARGWAPLRGVIAGRDKFIDLPIPELYDLAADPKEAQNGMTARADRARVLYNTLKGFNIAPPGRPQEETPDTIERLRSLGYIGGGSGTVREQFTEDDDPKRLIAIEQTMQRAAEARRTGRSDEAIAMYRDIIARRPDTEDAYRQLALVYWLAGQPRDAIATLESALKHGVTQREVRIKLGQYLTQSGQGRRAIELLQTFAADDPDALIALGNAYVAAGQTREAVKTFTHLLTIDPANGLAHQNIGIAELSARNYQAAEASLRRAVSLNPNLAGAYTALGVVLASTDRKDEAIGVWKRAVDLDGRETDALFNLTVNLAAAGRRDEARLYGERYLAIVPPQVKDAQTIKQLLDRLK